MRIAKTSRHILIQVDFGSWMSRLSPMLSSFNTRRIKRSRKTRLITRQQVVSQIRKIYKSVGIQKNNFPCLLYYHLVDISDGDLILLSLLPLSNMLCTSYSCNHDHSSSPARYTAFLRALQEVWMSKDFLYYLSLPSKSAAILWNYPYSMLFDFMLLATEFTD